MLSTSPTARITLFFTAYHCGELFFWFLVYIEWSWVIFWLSREEEEVKGHLLNMLMIVSLFSSTLAYLSICLYTGTDTHISVSVHVQYKCVCCTHQRDRCWKTWDFAVLDGQFCLCQCGRLYFPVFVLVASAEGKCWKGRHRSREMWLFCK